LYGFSAVWTGLWSRALRRAPSAYPFPVTMRPRCALPYGVGRFRRPDDEGVAEG